MYLGFVDECQVFSKYSTSLTTFAVYRDRIIASAVVALLFPAIKGSQQEEYNLPELHGQMFLLVMTIFIFVDSVVNEKRHLPIVEQINQA